MIELVSLSLYFSFLFIYFQSNGDVDVFHVYRQTPLLYFTLLSFYMHYTDGTDFMALLEDCYCFRFDEITCSRGYSFRLHDFTLSETLMM